MPDRILKSSILNNRTIAKLSFGAEVFYRRLMSVVDDFGVCDASDDWLRAHLYAFQLDQVSRQDVAMWKQEIKKGGLITIYEMDGIPYLEMVNFDQRLRARRSKWPHPIHNPPSFARNCQQPLTNATESDSESESESNSEAGAEAGSGVRQQKPPRIFPNEGMKLIAALEKEIEGLKEWKRDDWKEEIKARRVKIAEIKLQIGLVVSAEERRRLGLLESATSHAGPSRPDKSAVQDGMGRRWSGSQVGAGGTDALPEGNLGSGYGK